VLGCPSSFSYSPSRNPWSYSVSASATVSASASYSTSYYPNPGCASSYSSGWRDSIIFPSSSATGYYPYGTGGSSVTVLPIPSSTGSAPSCSETCVMLCIDYINDCGMMYGEWLLVLRLPFPRVVLIFLRWLCLRRGASFLFRSWVSIVVECFCYLRSLWQFCRSNLWFCIGVEHVCA
jgi:hypothetical protein